MYKYSLLLAAYGSLALEKARARVGFMACIKGYKPGSFGMYDGCCRYDMEESVDGLE